MSSKKKRDEKEDDLVKFIEEIQKKYIKGDEIEELKKMLDDIGKEEGKNIIQKIEYSLVY